MPVVSFLIIFPMVAGLLMFVTPNDKVRNAMAYISAIIIMATVAFLTAMWVSKGCVPYALEVPNEHSINYVILGAEIVLMIFVTVLCFIHEKYWISLLSIIPTILIARFEIFGTVFGTEKVSIEEAPPIYLDHLSILMCLIVGVIGGLIAIYAVGYLKGYHEHHKEVKDRRNFFMAILFVFLGAMFGFVTSDNIMWIDLFWEITSVCSFLLIGYTKDKEAVKNSFRALWMNLLGGTVLAIGIVYFANITGVESLHKIVDMAMNGNKAAAIVVAFTAFAALTKAAQLPFSTWLLGAMVAPTPSSALLHSATMVKAGVYILLRLAPAMYGTNTGTMIALIGGFTFLVTSFMAVSQSDAKKVLAFSTISNLGLMVACAGIGSEDTIWAGVFLMIFHAISKSLLFQDVGATENSLHSRDIEDMHGLLYILPKLSIFMFIGIAGMFLAPFGMLISKWAALKAAVDVKNILLVVFICFGSAVTSLYWTKWMGKIISQSHLREKTFKDITKKSESMSLIIHAVLMIGVCAFFPLLSQMYVEPLVTEIAGSSSSVIPIPVLILLVVIICIVFAVPFLAYLYSKNAKTNVKLSYMNGVNTGDNRRFVDSMGEEKTLWLSNYYLNEYFGLKKLLVPSRILSTAIIIVMMCMIIGGAL